jgi:hypothetical protein
MNDSDLWQLEARKGLSRELALRIIAQHGWESGQCVICVTPCECPDADGPASFDAELGVRNHYPIDDVRDFLGY